MHTTSKRSVTLDLLRACAICLVLLRHGPRESLGSGDAELLVGFGHNIAANGWLGVDLFFVLSGYLLGRQILSNIDNGTWSLSSFLARRAFRTLPAFLFVLIPLWLGALALPLGTQGVRDFGVLLSHLIFMNDYSGSPVLVTLWSLATEEKFYLLMAFGLPLVARWRRTAPAIILALYFASVASMALSYSPQAYLDYPAFFWAIRAPFQHACGGLLVGLATATLTRGAPKNDAILGRALFGAASLGMMSILMVTEWSADDAPEGALIAIPLFCMLAAISVGVSRHMDALFDARWSRVPAFLARISYSLYLAHYPVARLLDHWEVTYRIALHPGLEWVVYLLASLLAGWALFVCVERPGLSFRTRFSNWTHNSRRSDSPSTKEPLET